MLVAALLAVAAQTATAREPAGRTPPAATETTADGSPPQEDLPVRRPASTSTDRGPAGHPVRESAPSAPSKTTASETSPADDVATGTTKPGCGREGCTRCQPQAPTCKPKWEDKKTKKARFSMTCDFECVRPWEPYHQGDCCEEKTTPCGEVHVKKRLFKTEEERVERVLKYEVVMKPAPPCCPDEPECGCLGCRCLGATFHRLFAWCR